jgi:hypothetical protein
MIYLTIVLSSLSLVLETQVGASVIVWMVSKVRKLVPCWENS